MSASGLFILWAFFGVPAAGQDVNNDLDVQRFTLERQFRTDFTQLQLILKQDVPYEARAVVIGSDGSLSAKPVSPQDRLESFYSPAGTRVLLTGVAVEPAEVIFEFRQPTLRELLVTPPTFPGPVSTSRCSSLETNVCTFSLVVEYASAMERDDRVWVRQRLEQILMIQDSILSADPIQ